MPRVPRGPRRPPRHAWHRLVRPNLAAPAAASLLAIISVLSVAAGAAGKAAGNSYYVRNAKLNVPVPDPAATSPRSCSVQRRDGLRGMIRGLRRRPCESSKQNAYKHKRTTQSKSLAWPLLPQADRLRPRHSLTCSCARARGAFVTPRGKIYLKVVKIVKTRRVAP